jgi:hypothetical protein
VKKLALVAVLAALLAAPARADSGPAYSDQTPLGLDLIMRVAFGIPLTVAGAVAMVPAGIATAITRPSQMNETFDMLVMGPVRYTWVDPLGEHPDHHRQTNFTHTASTEPAPAPIVGQ